MRNLFGNTGSSALVAVVIIALLCAVIATLAWVDRRLLKAAANKADFLPVPTPFVSLLVPAGTAAVLFSSQTVLGPTHLSTTFGLLTLFVTGARLLQVPARMLSAASTNASSDEHASRWRHRVVVPGYVVLALSALIVVARSITVAPALVDLLTLVRNIVLMLAVVSTLSARSDFMMLFPLTGNARYLAIRRFIGRMVVVLLGASLVLLLLWNLGFRRAAETLLLRSYAVLAVVLAGALAARWLGDKQEETRQQLHPVLEVLVGPADWVLRLVVYGTLAWALCATLGLWSPLTVILAQPFLWVGSGGISVLGLAKGVAVVVLAAYISRTIRAAMEVWWFSALEVPAATQSAVSTGVHYLTMLIAGAGALTLSGVDLRGLAVFAGAAGLGVGLGLREVAAQTISGMTLLFSGTLGRGDCVTLPNGQFGRVVEVGLRRTLFDTPDGSHVSVPSSDLVNGQIVVWTRRSPYVRVRAAVTLPTGSELDAVRECLLTAAERVQHREADHPTKVWLKEAVPAGQVWEVMAWVDVTETTPEESASKLLAACIEELRGRQLPLARPTLTVTPP